MKRLTEKIDNNMYLSTLFQEPIINDKNVEQLDKSHSKIVHKLGQLEDLEEEIGIDLITLFKALKNGIYVAYKINREFSNYDREFGKCKNANIVFIENWRISIVDLEELEIYFGTEDYEHICFDEYGKSWALTSEELEK